MRLGLATAMASSAPKFEVYTTDTLPTPHHTTRHHGVVQEPVEGREFMQNARPRAGIETIFELSSFTFDTDWIGCIEYVALQQTFHKESKYLHISTFNEDIETGLRSEAYGYLLYRI